MSPPLTSRPGPRRGPRDAAEETAGRLPDRLAGLDEVLDLAPNRLGPGLVDAVRAVRTQAGERLALSSAHTVVALAGATGSGKSSLFNALAGAELAAVGVRRPTTARTQSCAWGPDSPDDLLAWLGVGRRSRAGESTGQRTSTGGGGPDSDAGLDGLVLLDLPDHDSTATEHRLEVDRLVARVDLLVWVVDPQKYADAALHERYLRPLADHAAVMLVVLNQADLLSAADLARCRADLGRLLAADGLGGVEVLVTSTVTGTGVPDLRARLAAAVARRLAAVQRLSADLDGLARRLDHAVPAGSGRSPEAAAERAETTAALAQVAGVDAVVAAVAGVHRGRGITATGWPPTRWLRRLRPDPLRRLHLDRAVGPDSTPGVPTARTSLPPPSAVSRSRLDVALRRLADGASEGLPDAQVRRVREVLRERTDPLADALDVAVARTDLGLAREPRWWRAADLVQWLAVLVALVGAAWLAVDVVLGWLQLPALPAPDVGRVPLPTLLLAGGALLGLLLAGLFRVLVGAGARRRARRARQRLHAAVAAVADERLLRPLDTELAAWRRLREAVVAVGGGGGGP